MTEAEHAETYEQRIQAIQQANQPILDGFEKSLKQAGLSEHTIKAHVDNIGFFGRSLLWYGYSLRRIISIFRGSLASAGIDGPCILLVC
jgi:hypothetical protein